MIDKFISLRVLAKKLLVDYRTLRDLIACHDDLETELNLYENKETPKKNKRLLPPKLTNLIYERFK